MPYGQKPPHRSGEKAHKAYMKRFPPSLQQSYDRIHRHIVDMGRPDVEWYHRASGETRYRTKSRSGHRGRIFARLRIYNGWLCAYITEPPRGFRHQHKALMQNIFVNRGHNYWYGREQLELAFDVADPEFESQLSAGLLVLEDALDAIRPRPLALNLPEAAVLRKVHRAEAEARKGAPAPMEHAIRDWGLAGISYPLLLAEAPSASYVLPNAAEISRVQADIEPASALREAAGYPAYAARTSPDWLISISSDFRKSVERLDRKLQGRVLEALNELCQAPMRARGDTVKPLSGNLAGKWRYRIGDYRLIYAPDERAHTVLLLEVFPRGTAYVD